MIVMVVVVTLAVVLFLFLPLVTLLNWWYGKAGQNNPATIGVTKIGMVFSAIMILILLAGILVEAFLPNTWMADFYKEIGGLNGWSFIVTTTATLVALGLRRYGIELYYFHGPVWDDRDPVKDWVSVEKEKAPVSGSAYAIEFQNDHKTPMQFVLSMFVHCFGMNVYDAYREMMVVHEKGSRIVGSMSRLNAEALVEHIHAEAAKRGFPFRCKVVLAAAKTES